MDISIDKLLQLIGSLHVQVTLQSEELIRMRNELDKRVKTEGSKEDTRPFEPTGLPSDRSQRIASFESPSKK